VTPVKATQPVDHQRRVQVSDHAGWRGVNGGSADDPAVDLSEQLNLDADRINRGLQGVQASLAEEAGKVPDLLVQQVGFPRSCWLHGLIVCQEGAGMVVRSGVIRIPSNSRLSGIAPDTRPSPGMRIYSCSRWSD
jgi:hypothetical protein